MVEPKQKATPKSRRKKPEPPESLLDNIAAASQNAKRIYFIYSGLLAFCVLTVAGTADRQIILNERITLPIIAVNVSLQGFFILAPVLVLFFIYLQIYLNKLQRLFHALRNDYAPIKEDERIYPWMLNFAEELGSGLVARTQRFIVNFSIWWSLPLVLMLLALWYLKKHDPVSVIGHGPLVATLLVVAFWTSYEYPGGHPYKFTFKDLKSFVINNRHKSTLLAIALLFEICFYWVLMPRALRGDRILGAWPAVNVSYENLSSGERGASTRLYNVDLKDAKLQGGNFRGAILKKADLRGADLSYADFTNALLQHADLRGANLRHAILKGARLDSAKLDSANLAGARCQGASFRGASLQNLKHDSLAGGVWLREADLPRANLRDADLQQADFKDADLRFADLSYAKLKSAVFRGARLDSAVLIGVETDSTTDFRGAVLIRERVDFQRQDRDNLFRIPRILPKSQLRSTPIPDVPDSLLDSLTGDRFLTSVDSMLQDKKLFDRRRNPDTTNIIVTGFELQQRGLVVVDTVNGLMWQQSGSRRFLTYKEAKAHVDTLNARTFAGFSDWRLPTLEEAMSLMRPVRNDRGLYIDPVFDARQYWIWTADRWSASGAWFVSFYTGGCFQLPVSNYGGFVRAVR